MSDIRDNSLAAAGEEKIQWVVSYMPLLNKIRNDIKQSKPFNGLNIALCII